MVGGDDVATQAGICSRSTCGEKAFEAAYAEIFAAIAKAAGITLAYTLRQLRGDSDDMIEIGLNVLNHPALSMDPSTSSVARQAPTTSADRRAATPALDARRQKKPSERPKW
jgi:hypothetical protein